MALQSIRVWDGPTRAFHWLLVMLVALAFGSGLQGGNWMIWHQRAGLAIIGLLSFRLLWGFVGSTHARFTDFFPTPGRIASYLRGNWSGVGHNPLGALSVFALLLLLLIQALTGLFANDDIAFNGPLFALVSSGLSDELSSLHRRMIWLIGALVVLHILAALFYTLIKRNNIIGPMVTGSRRVEPALIEHGQVRPATGGGILVLLLSVAVAGVIVWMASGGLLPPPQRPAPLPSW